MVFISKKQRRHVPKECFLVGFYIPKDLQKGLGSSYMLHILRIQLLDTACSVLKQLPEAHVEKPQATCEDGREQQESLVGSWKGIVLMRRWSVFFFGDFVHL